MEMGCGGEQHVRLEDVVCIQEQEVLRVGLIGSRVPGRCRAPVPVVDGERDPGVLLGEPVDDGTGGVATAVVHHEQCPSLKRLGQHVSMVSAM
jgi:hypothetical protein